MTHKEFLKKARRYARKNRLGFSFHPDQGKGSHGAVFIDQYRTTLKYGEIGPGLLASMLKDLNIERRDF